MSNDVENSPLIPRIYSQLVKDLPHTPYAELFSFNNEFSVEETAFLQKALITMLLDANQLSIDQKDLHGKTLLIWASQDGHKELVELLLQRQANVDLFDEHGETALFKSVFYNRLSVAHLLLSHGAATEIANILGSTPLSFAIFNHCERNMDQLEIIKRLLEHRSSRNEFSTLEGVDNQHLLETALNRGKYQVYYLLLKEQHLKLHPEDNYLQFYFSQFFPKDDVAALDYLLKMEPDFLIQHPESLNLTIVNRCDKMAQRMLELSSPELRKRLFAFKNCNGNTALFEAFRHYEALCAQVLLAYGDDFTILDSDEGIRLLEARLDNDTWVEMLNDYADMIEKMVKQTALVEKAAIKIFQYDQEKKVSVEESALPDELVDLIKRTPAILDLQARYNVTEQTKTMLEKCFQYIDPHRFEMARAWRKAPK